MVSVLGGWGFEELGVGAPPSPWGGRNCSEPEIDQTALGQEIGVPMSFSVPGDRISARRQKGKIGVQPLGSGMYPAHLGDAKWVPANGF